MPEQRRRQAQLRRPTRATAPVVARAQTSTLPPTDISNQPPHPGPGAAPPPAPPPGLPPESEPAPAAPVPVAPAVPAPVPAPVAPETAPLVATPPTAATPLV